MDGSRPAYLDDIHSVFTGCACISILSLCVCLYVGRKLLKKFYPK